ncbi:MAG: isochorismatase family protein [Pseudomonadota bacterium]
MVEKHLHAFETTGIIVTDVQGDFTTLKNGSLSVPGTDQNYLDAVNQATERFRTMGLKLFATQDWHPADHISFYTSHPGRQPFDTLEINGRSQILWPPHCVQGTRNADLLLDRSLFLGVVRKGLNRLFDSYSGFQDDGGFKTGMDHLLRSHGVDTLVIYGIATDFCIKATALDAVQAGFRVVVAAGLCRGISRDGIQAALDEMGAVGIQVIEGTDFSALF